MGLPLDWRRDPIVQIENVMLPVLTGTCAILMASDDQRSARARWHSDVQKVIGLLRSGADEWLDPAGFPLDADGRKICNDAADALAKLNAQVERDAGTKSPTAAVTAFQTECLPSLMRALDAIRAVFIGGVLVRQSQHAANTERALQELGTISKTILFISINASIEAGRAGDAGRSFSVIAGDIRTLAQNAQQTIAAIKAG